MILRGCTITKVATSKKEKGPHVGRLTIRIDPAKELIERMGWDCLLDTEGKFTNGWDSLPLNGEIALVKAKLIANRKDGTKCEITATQLQGFVAHRIKGKGEGESVVYISAVVLSDDAEFAIRVDPYWRAIGDGKSQLSVGEAQVSMFPAEKDEDGDEE